MQTLLYKRLILLVLCLVIVYGRAASAQLTVPAGPTLTDPAARNNPLAALNDELEQVLAAAGVSFSDEQGRAIALMMEERRRASEALFGDLMDFRGGPTQGQDEDRLRSAIDWMRGEFLRLLDGYLTAEQKDVWEAHLAAAAAGREAAAAVTEAETQFVRLNTNVFTAEEGNFESGGGQNTDVIQRGGVGAWHGNVQFLLKDDSLNARNAFAENKPPYQERRLNADVSGPVIPGRLTSSVAFNQRETENVTTVRATLPDGVFALGITRPNVYRQINLRSTYQIASSHSVRAFMNYSTETGRGQGIGNFTLPERRSDQFRHQWNVGLFPFSAPSSRHLFEGSFRVNSNQRETVPFSEALRINVLDAFNGGGAQNYSEDRNRTYQFGNLYTRFGERLTLKTGIDGAYRMERSLSRNNFEGTFTFSSLDDYVAGAPLTYRVNRGDPLIETNQLEMAGFIQADLVLSPRVTMLVGLRYEVQQNLADYNNLAPRVAVAWSPGPATVIRGGGGMFYGRLSTGMVENQRRFDGQHQFEIVIDDPSYPDPFASGRVRESLPSVRVTDNDLVAPYFAVGMVSLERTFFSNLLLTATYDLQREYHRLRTRNLNAPHDLTVPEPRACRPELAEEACAPPDPSRGQLINLESTGNEVRHTVQLGLRKRFSIFNASGTYQLRLAHGDVQGGDGTLATDSYDLRGDWGRAPFPTHEFSGTVNARLPLGVFLTGQMAFSSGRHYTITTGLDDNRDSNVNDRPRGLPPNSLRGPKYVNVNLNLSKAFFLRREPGRPTSGTNMNVFLNVTNVLNHVHYGTPSGVMTSPNFGRSTSAQDPRELEAGVRFQF